MQLLCKRVCKSAQNYGTSHLSDFNLRANCQPELLFNDNQAFSKILAAQACLGIIKRIISLLHCFLYFFIDGVHFIPYSTSLCFFRAGLLLYYEAVSQQSIWKSLLFASNKRKVFFNIFNISSTLYTEINVSIYKWIPSTLCLLYWDTSLLQLYCGTIVYGEFCLRW